MPATLTCLLLVSPSDSHCRYCCSTQHLGNFLPSFSPFTIIPPPPPSHHHPLFIHPSTSAHLFFNLAFSCLCLFTSPLGRPFNTRGRGPHIRFVSSGSNLSSTLLGRLFAVSFNPSLLKTPSCHSQVLNQPTFVLIDLLSRKPSSAYRLACSLPLISCLC